MSPRSGPRRRGAEKKSVRRVSAKVPRKKSYGPIMEKLFADRYTDGATQVHFSRTDIEEVAQTLGVDPKNLGDLVYTFRYRRKLPESVRAKAASGETWIIRGAGDAKYSMILVDEDYAYIRPRSGMDEIKIPDGTPGIIVKYSARQEEQALLAVLRYNRLIDIFLGISCYSLQNHLRTKLKGIGQVETDELYVGIDAAGAHYVVPVQAKGGSDEHNIVQVEQDFALCELTEPYNEAICRPVAAQFVEGGRIALFAFRRDQLGVAKIVAERHYRLVPPDQLTEADLERYRRESLSGVPKA